MASNLKNLLRMMTIAGVSCSMMSGCSPYHAVKYSSTRTTTAKGDSSAAPTTAAPQEYQLGFGDVLEIKFFNNERFNETVAVRPDGRITLEKMGDIAVTGMTPSRLDSMITARYATFLREPEVTVFVRQFGGYQVYVFGEVNHPGGFPLQRDMNIFQALATAGGHKDSAKLASVIVLRPSAGAGVQAFKIDINRALQEHDNIALALQPQDVVYVPKTVIANASTFLSQVYDGALPPLDVYARALLYKNR